MTVCLVPKAVTSGVTPAACIQNPQVLSGAESIFTLSSTFCAGALGLTQQLGGKGNRMLEIKQREDTLTCLIMSIYLKKENWPINA